MEATEEILEEPKVESKEEEENAPTDKKVVKKAKRGEAEKSSGFIPADDDQAGPVKTDEKAPVEVKQEEADSKATPAKKVTKKVVKKGESDLNKVTVLMKYINDHFCFSN